MQTFTFALRDWLHSQNTRTHARTHTHTYTHTHTRTHTPHTHNSRTHAHTHTYTHHTHTPNTRTHARIAFTHISQCHINEFLLDSLCTETFLSSQDFFSVYFLSVISFSALSIQIKETMRYKKNGYQHTHTLSPAAVCLPLFALSSCSRCFFSSNSPGVKVTDRHSPFLDTR